MHPRTRELLTHFDAHRTILKSAFDCVPPDRRNKPPEPGRWSTANVVEHLAIVEGRPPEEAGELRSHLDESRTYKVHAAKESSRTRLAITEYRPGTRLRN